METIKIYKIGSGLLDDSEKLAEFLYQFSKIKEKKILVHGGGKYATKLNDILGNEVIFHDGRRVTDEKTIEVVTMVYAGKINKSIVASLQNNNCNSIGISGIDGNLLKVKKRNSLPIDFGFVGDIESVNTAFLNLLLTNEIVPVVCSIAGDQGELLNINADTIAKEISVALTDQYNVELYYIMDKNGVLQDAENDHSVIETIKTSEFNKLIDNKIISEGMIPKLKNAFDAKNENISKVVITSAMNVMNETSLKTEIIN
jgi:acetylglutamate kinase